MTEKLTIGNALRRVTKQPNHAFGSVTYYREDEDTIQLQTVYDDGTVTYNTFFFDEEGNLKELL